MEKTIDEIFGTLRRQSSDLYRKRLDALYWTNIDRYRETLAEAKRVGYRVYRDLRGRHKIKTGEKI